MKRSLAACSLERKPKSASAPSPHSSVFGEAHRLSQSVAHLLQVMARDADDSMLDQEQKPGPTLLFFLDLQGKEYIQDIGEMFSALPATLVFVSLGLTAKSTPHRLLATSDQCKALATEMRLVDPLGGGEYPVNYVTMVDSAGMVRCQLPLRFRMCYTGYQKFAVAWLTLPLYVAEFMEIDSRLRVEAPCIKHERPHKLVL